MFILNYDQKKLDEFEKLSQQEKNKHFININKWFIKDEEKELEVLGGYDVKEKKVITLDEFNILAQLPTKDILLAQMAIVFTMPIKKLMFALNSRKEQIEAQ